MKIKTEKLCKIDFFHLSGRASGREPQDLALLSPRYFCLLRFLGNQHVFFQAGKCVAEPRAVDSILRYGFHVYFINLFSVLFPAFLPSGALVHFWRTQPFFSFLFLIHCRSQHLRLNGVACVAIRHLKRQEIQVQRRNRHECKHCPFQMATLFSLAALRRNKAKIQQVQFPPEIKLQLFNWSPVKDTGTLQD